MKNRYLFLMTIVIMFMALFFMGINRLIFTMPDWTVRVIGIVIMTDLVALVYSSIKIIKKNFT